MRKLFVAAVREAGPIGQRDAALLAVLYGGGLRRDEASRLDLGDVRPDGLRVVGKGSKERLQPLSTESMRAVGAWVGARGNLAGPLFVAVGKGGRVSGRRLSGDAIHDVIERLAARAEIAPTAPHDLRRTFVGALLEAGEDLSTASKAAGHSSVSVTARYDRRERARVARR